MQGESAKIIDRRQQDTVDGKSNPTARASLHVARNNIRSTCTKYRSSFAYPNADNVVCGVTPSLRYGTA